MPSVNSKQQTHQLDGVVDGAEERAVVEESVAGPHQRLALLVQQAGEPDPGGDVDRSRTRVSGRAEGSQVLRAGSSQRRLLHSYRDSMPQLPSRLCSSGHALKTCDSRAVPARAVSSGHARAFVHCAFASWLTPIEIAQSLHERGRSQFTRCMRTTASGGGSFRTKTFSERVWST